MSSMQIVFLFDLNSLNGVHLKSEIELNQHLLNFRLVCLRLLTQFSTRSSSLRWGFKFFDSRGSLMQEMPNFSYSNVSLESCETLESEVCVRYRRHISYCTALAESVQHNLSDTVSKNNQNKTEVGKPVKLLQLALTQILCEYQWENMDIWSPSTKNSAHSNHIRDKNFLFLITKCADNQDDFFSYFGTKFEPTRSSKLASMLLSPSLREQLLEKANAHWVWLNTLPDQSFLGCSSEILAMMSEAIHSLQGSLIPLSLLSQSNYILKVVHLIKKSLVEREPSEMCNMYESLHTSLVPFSSLLHQSLSYPFYLKKQSTNDCMISFHQSNKNLPIIITSLPTCWNRILEKASKANVKKQSGRKSSRNLNIEKCCNMPSTWSKFFIQYAVERNLQETSYDMLLCLPNMSMESSSYNNFKELIKVLFLRKIDLVVECQTVCGLQMPGLFSPLSDVSAVISILDPSMYFLKKRNFDFSSSHKISEKSVDSTHFKAKIEEEIQHLKTAFISSTVDSLKSASSFHLKPFQMESIETWFEPTTTVTNLASKISQQNSSSKMILFHKMLQMTSDSNKCLSLKASKIESEEPKESVSQPDSTLTNNQTYEMYSDLNLEELKLKMHEIYNSALQSSCAIQSAKKIMSIVSHYFQGKSTTYEMDVQEFMKENFWMSSRSISEKYDKCKPEEDSRLRIKEYQMQAFLALEIEALIPSSDPASCVHTVTSLLRMMSFFSGASELNKLLREILRENYGHNLCNVLSLIGEELDIPIVGNSESPDSLNDALSSEFMDDSDIFSSVISSAVSTRSSSSESSKRDNRKLVRRRSDISDTSKSRQILMPGASPKKKKSKASVQKKPVRCSPRLASRKRKERVKIAESKSSNVCRNLFPRERVTGTPVKNGHASSKYPGTPKGNRTSKMHFVAETPTHEQKHSACQRKKSFPGKESTLKEVAESPEITSKVNVELLKKLKRHPSSSRNENQIVVNKEVNNSKSFTQHTPESKRRLSLKLFCKYLSSPTARTGIKKCSKRLFDQVSPHSYNKSRKKLKFHHEFENTSETGNGVNQNGAVPSVAEKHSNFCVTP